MYADYDECVARYAALATWGKTPTEVSSDLIYYAEIELNGRLGSHFSVPFSADHPTVKDLTIDLAYYRAIRTTDPSKAKALHAAVLGRIDDIKKGKEYIYTGSGTIILPDGADQEIWSTTQDYHPVHGMLEAEDAGSRIDPDRLDDESDERD